MYLYEFSSEYSSEWFDCVGEDEKYIRDKENFYQKCTAITKDSEVPTELLEVTKDTCFENRKCRSLDGDEKEMFVACDSRCTCENILLKPNRTSVSSQRPKRKTGEVFVTSANVQRVLRTESGGRRLATDIQQLTRRKGDYALIRQEFIDYTNLIDEEYFEFVF